MLRLKHFALLAFSVFYTSQSFAGTGSAATSTNSATAARYLTGCGFDYECDSDGNIIKNVPTTPKSYNSANVVDLGGGSHSVEIISGKPKQPSLKPKEMPLIVQESSNSESKVDPFADDASLDSKYEVKPSSANGNQSERKGVANYGGDGDIALQKQAFANKQARLAKEQEEREADAASFANAITNTMMGAAISHIDSKNAKKSGGSSSSSGTTGYYSRGYADTVYSRDSGGSNSATYNKAKTMTGGGGWW